MRIYKRKADGTGPWWFATHHRGKPIRRTTGTEDREAAKEYAERYAADLWRADKLDERPDVAWAEACSAWIDDHQHLRSLSDREDHFRWAREHLRGKTLRQIDRAELARLGRLKKADGVTDATVNRVLASIRAVLGYAVEQGWLDSAPNVPKRREVRKGFRWATRAQAAKLILALPPHLAAMVRLSLATGMRRFNVTHLEWSRVDLARKIAWVYAEDAKGGETFSVPLNADALAVLRAQRGGHKRWVFTYQRAVMTRPGADVWRAACKKAGLKNFRWHDLRHTWASWHVQNGTPLLVLKDLGHWKSIAMVQRYAHLAPSHLSAYASNSQFENGARTAA